MRFSTFLITSILVASGTTIPTVFSLQATPNNSKNILGRRPALASLFTATTAAATTTLATTQKPKTPVVPFLPPATIIASSSILVGGGIDPAVAWIDAYCDREFLSAVVASEYRFLYRGLTDDTTTNNKVVVRSESPDLLEPSTYGNDPNALVFFRDLERTMTTTSCPLRPSMGHLATSSVAEASRWGPAVSIWPMRGTDYAWFSDRQLFYPRPSTTTTAEATLICNGRNCGTDSLDDALVAENAEVLFTAQPFLAVPAAMDESLRAALRTSFLL